MEIAEYIRTIMNIHPKVEKAKGRTTRDWMRQEDQMNLSMKKPDDNSESNLLPIISALTNHPGFKYKLEDGKANGVIKKILIYDKNPILNKNASSFFIHSPFEILFL